MGGVMGVKRVLRNLWARGEGGAGMGRTWNQVTAPTALINKTVLTVS